MEYTRLNRQTIDELKQLLDSCFKKPGRSFSFLASGSVSSFADNKIMQEDACYDLQADLNKALEDMDLPVNEYVLKVIRGESPIS